MVSGATASIPMPMSEAADARSITIQIGEEKFTKPYDPRCAVCRSPWMADIDSCLAQGWTYSSIRTYLAARRPPPPPQKSYAAHVAHLAPPHFTARRQLEESAILRGQGQDGGIPLADLGDVAQAALQKVYARMATGEIEPPLRDVIGAMRLHNEILSKQQGNSSVQACQDALIEIYEIARRVMDNRTWQMFVHEVYNSEVIVSVMGRPAAPALAMVPSEGKPA